MLQGASVRQFEDLLLRVAVEPTLREEVYQQLREYCHQCRNQLNSLKLSLYLATRRTAEPSHSPWAEVERSYLKLESRIEQIQFLCRPLQLSRVKIGLDLLIDDRREAWSRRMAEQGGRLAFLPPRERAVAYFDVEALGRALDSVVDWRASVEPGGRSAQIRWWVADGRAHVGWEERATVLTAGDSSEAGGPSVWTLPSLAKVVLAHGGDYRIDSDGDWRLEVRWPAV